MRKSLVIGQAINANTFIILGVDKNQKGGQKRDKKFGKWRDL
jgi:hypothetical protein